MSKTKKPTRQLIDEELETRDKLTADIEITRTAIAKAEETLRSTAYNAEKGDPEAIQAQTDALEVITKSQRAIRQKELALAQSVSILAALNKQLKYEWDDEAWQKIISDFQRIIDGDAADLDRHFFGSDKGGIKPLVPLIEAHETALYQITDRIRTQAFCPDLTEVFGLFLYYHLHRLLGRLIGQPDPYSGDYTAGSGPFSKVRGETWRENLIAMKAEISQDRANTISFLRAATSR